MLSILFDDNDAHEWWVSGRVFERLFLSALNHGHLAPALEEWRFVADANGGLSQLEPEVARELLEGLRAAAHEEIARLRDAAPSSEEWGYRIDFEKFLAATKDIRFGAREGDT